METFWILFTVAIFLWYLVYDKYERKEETKVLIRELTVSLKSKDIASYTDNKPIYKEPKEVKELVKDEIISLEDIDPTQLLRSLSGK